MEKYGFVYIWFDRKHKRYYVGCHWGTEDDGYICSSRWMKASYKRRPDDFKRRIIIRIYTNKKDLFEKEQYYLNMVKKEEIKVRYYNLHTTVARWTTDENKALTIKEKISKKTKEAMQRPEVKEKYKEGLKTRIYKKSDDGARSHREAMIKYWEEKSPVENRQTWLDKDSSELKEVHRNNTKKLWENPEYRNKVIKSKPFIIDEVEYQLLIDAAKVYNVTPRTITCRLNSKTERFKNWKYI